MALKFLNDGYFAGKVGIGAPPNSKKLEVTGNASIEGTLTVETSSNNIRLLDSNDSTVNFSVGVNGRFQIRDVGGVTNPFQIEKDALSNSLYIKGNGNVGIGTDNPLSTLHVAGPSTLATQGTVLKIENTADQGSAQDIHIYNQYDRDVGIKFETLGGTNYIWQDSNSDDSLILSSGGANRTNDGTLIIHQSHNVFVPNGKVGIGATSADHLLTLQSSGDTILQINRKDDTIQGGNRTGIIQFGARGTWGTNLQTSKIWSYAEEVFTSTANGTSLRFFTTELGAATADEKMIIDTNGNVGIGTDNPTQTLHVGDGTIDAVIRSVYTDGSYTDIHGYGIFMSRSASYIKPVTDNTQGLYLGDIATGANWSLVQTNAATNIWKKDATEFMRLTSSGNLGIGDTGPATTLQVSTDSLTNNVAVQIGDGWVSNDAYHKEGGFLLISGTSQAGTQTGAGIAFQTRNNANTNYLKSSVIMDRDGAMRFTLGGAGTVAGSEDFTILSNGNVGIGITTPNAKLQVGATVNVNATGISFAAGAAVGNLISRSASHNNWFPYTDGNNYYSADNHIFRNASTSVEYMRVNSSGNVGIGTTSPSQKLQVEGNSWIKGIYYDTSGDAGSSGQILSSTASGTTWISGSAIPGVPGGSGTLNTIPLWTPDGDTLGDSHITQSTALANDIIIPQYVRHTSDTNTYFGFGLNDTINFGTSGSERMRIDSAGNVGIGNTAPTYRLVIGGNGGLSDSIKIGNYEVAKDTRQYIGYARADTGLFETASSGNTPSTVLAGVAGIRIVNTAGSILSSKADQSIQLLTHIYNGGSRVALHADPNGKVGIGTTSPAYELDVNGDIRARENIRVFGNSLSSIPYNSPSETSVNIGTYLNDFGWIDIASSNSGGGWLDFSKANGGDYSGRIRYVNSTDQFQISTNGTQKMVIESGGNVGIGTTSPTAGLHVVGTGLFTGLVSGITPVNAANFVTKAYVDGSGGGTGPFLPLAGGTMTGTIIQNGGNIDFSDGRSANFGNGDDLQIYHNTHNFITSINGDLTIDSQGDDLILKSADDFLVYVQGTEIAIQAVGNAGVKLRYNSLNRFETTNTGVSVIGDVVVDSALLSNQENTDIDSAAAEMVAQVAIATYTAAFFDFVVKKSTNVRSGTVYACHDGTSVEFTETSTQDLGDTSDVVLSVDISGGNMRLMATVASDDWSVKSLIRAI